MAKQKKENRWYHEKSTLTVFLVLRFLVILTAILSAVRRDYESVFISCFTLLLFLLPNILTKRLRVTLPSTLECIILLFVFAANILGEINNFYVRVPHWDTLLHTLNGFNCAAIGFAMVDFLNREERFSIRLSPLYLAVVAFCFSMTVGVCWEIYEYIADHLFTLDMQKDAIVHSFNTVMLDATNDNTIIQKSKPTTVKKYTLCKSPWTFGSSMISRIFHPEFVQPAIESRRAHVATFERLC